MSDRLPPLRDVIAALDLRAKKSLGQNFLLDLNLTRKIARAAEAEGAVIYEVGPGPGGLTRALADGRGGKSDRGGARCPLPAGAGGHRARVTPGKLEVIMRATPWSWTKTAPACLQGAHIAANLPYNVGTALLIKWLSG